MADSELMREAKLVSRSVSRISAKKRREFAANAKDFDLEAAYKTVLALIDRCQFLLKLLGYLTDRIQVNGSPDILAAHRIKGYPGQNHLSAHWFVCCFRSRG
jgi:hypothetical protein